VSEPKTIADFQRERANRIAEILRARTNAMNPTLELIRIRMERQTKLWEEINKVAWWNK